MEQTDMAMATRLTPVNARPQAQKHGTVVAGMAQAAYQEQLKKAASGQPGAAAFSGAH